jgi:carbon monoxide dehydrogenase subunit G
LEADDRMRVIAEIKIGPIGARFNALVTRSEVSAPHAFTMTIEGQGGTVGFVKSGAKLRLADDPSGGTLLSYDVDAEVGGRLAQLGGPILDATAKQLSAKFFRQLSTVIGAPGEAAAAAPAAGMAVPPEGAPVLRPPAAALPGAAAAPSGTRGLPMAWLLAVCVAALVGYLIGDAGHAGGGSDWMGLAIGLLLFIVAAVGFDYGRRTASPVLTLDAALLARLARIAQLRDETDETKETKR